MIAIDLRKQQALKADLKSMQKINFSGDLKFVASKTVFIVIQEFKETILDVLQGTAKVL